MFTKRRLLTFFYSAAAFPMLFAQETGAIAESGASSSSGLRYVAAAIAISISALASGFAVAKIGQAAMAAMAQNSELSHKSLPYLAIAEGICLWGFLIALLILFF
ncbi:MAG TPA: ATP synthase subunit C [Spirochaetales bacterium]|nr:ATP synthase subunit C [Spirochaetales bacterium]